MQRIDLPKETRRLEKWLRVSRVIHDSNEKEMAKFLKKRLDPGICGCIAFRSIWHANAGNFKLLQGNEDGWSDLQRCLSHHCWSIRIQAAYQDVGKYGWCSLIDFSAWLTFALAFRLDSFATWFGDRMVASFRSQDDKYRIGPPSPYHLAFLQFYSLWRDNGFDIRTYTQDSLGVYQEILDSWKHEPAFAKALINGCDYHVAQMHEEEGYSEFLAAPQNLLPIEVLMIRRIREDQGLPTPEIDHPLMKSPLAQPPKMLPEVRDELLDQVIAKARAELPIGDPW